MASRYAPKIVVRKVALEMIIAGKAADLVPGQSAMARGELLDAVEKIVQHDRIELTDDLFRAKYVNFIRKYWGARSGFIEKDH